MQQMAPRPWSNTTHRSMSRLEACSTTAHRKYCGAGILPALQYRTGRESVTTKSNTLQAPKKTRLPRGTGSDNLPHKTSGSAFRPAHCHTGHRRPGDPFARTIYHNVPTLPRGSPELRHDIVMGGPFDNSSRARCALGNCLPGRLLARRWAAGGGSEGRG